MFFALTRQSPESRCEKRGSRQRGGDVERAALPLRTLLQTAPRKFCLSGWLRTRFQKIIVTQLCQQRIAMFAGMIGIMADDGNARERT